MVPQPYVNASGQESSRIRISVGEQQVPTVTAESLVEAIGRELWLAADELISASAGLTIYKGNIKIARAYSPVDLLKASLSLRIAADKIMEGYWETAKTDLANAAMAFSTFIPSNLFQPLVDAFSYYIPLPASEWYDTSESLSSLAEALEPTIDTLRSDPLLPFRGEACAAMSRAADSFRRAGNLFNEEDNSLPPDPRRRRCPSATSADEAFQGSLFSLYQEALSMLAADSPTRVRIEQIYSQVRTMAKRPGCRSVRRNLMEEMTKSCACNAETTDDAWDSERFFISVFLHRLRGYDIGVVFPSLERVKEQLQSVSAIPGSENARHDMLLEFEREFKARRNRSRGGDSEVVYNYVQRLLLVEEQRVAMSLTRDSI